MFVCQRCEGDNVDNYSVLMDGDKTKVKIQRTNFAQSDHFVWFRCEIQRVLNSIMRDVRRKIVIQIERKQPLTVNRIELF